VIAMGTLFFFGGDGFNLRCSHGNKSPWTQNNTDGTRNCTTTFDAATAVIAGARAIG